MLLKEHWLLRFPRGQNVNGSIVVEPIKHNIKRLSKR